MWNLTLRGGASLVLMASLMLALAACHRQPPATAAASEPLPFATLAVTERAMPRRQIWDGTVQAVNSTVLWAQTDGRVLDLPQDVNDVVAAGTVLVRFTDVEQKSATRAAAAQIAAARATLVNAAASYQRVAAIFAKGLLAKAALDDARAQRDAAQAALNAAIANRTGTAQQQDYTVVRAPYAGIITQRFVSVGEAVAGPPFPQKLIALTSLQNLRVEVKVPQGAAATIRKFAQAAVILPGGKQVEATRVTVFPYADPASHTFDIRVQLPAGRGGLLPGMSVKVAFADGSARRLLVPEAALWRRGEITGVYVIHDGTVNLRMVRLGPRFSNEVEVIAGLTAGEVIAHDPLQAIAWLTGNRAGANRPARDSAVQGP